MPVDLQELVDDLAEVLGRPLALDDPEWRLLAASAYLGEDDTVRRHSLLARTTPPEVVAWLEEMGIPRAAGPVEVPANPSLGIGGRIYMPVRMHGATLAFVSILTGNHGGITAAEREALQSAAGRAAEVLWERRARSFEDQRSEAELLSALLDELDPSGRSRALVSLRDRPRWGSPASTFGLAFASLTEDAIAGEVGERARRRWASPDLIWSARGTRITALARMLGGRPSKDLAEALVGAGAGCAVARELDDLGEAHEAVDEVGDSLLVIELLPELGPSATVPELGAWPAVARLWLALGQPDSPRPLAAMLDHRQADQLIAALEAFLEVGGDVPRAAKRIHVHRSTLYRRLELAQNLTGLSLDTGNDRLELHLALRMLRLAAAGGTRLRSAAHEPHPAHSARPEDQRARTARVAFEIDGEAFSGKRP